MPYKVPVWSEISIDAIAHNIEQLKSITDQNSELMAIVKANAYGHGAEQVARVALKNGATRLGLARVHEGEILRKAGIDAPVLILGYTAPEEYYSLLVNDFTQTVYSIEMAQNLSKVATKVGKVAKIHIKLDTGMGRLGFLPCKSAIKEIVDIANLPNLYVEGIYTHFADADSRNKDYTMDQLRKFNEFTETLSQKGLHFLYKHAANSAGLIDLPITHLDMVRAGIAMYGIYPSQEVLKEKVSLIPAMTVKAKVAHVKSVPANTGISYGVTYTTPEDAVVATIPAGYADGYNRLLSSKGEVLIRGKRAPVIGRVCMDQIMVDIGKIPNVKPGEEVVLMGHQGEDKISADEIAAKIGTIPYEVLCMISARVPRYYIKSLDTVVSEKHNQK